jgi:hypothetical protein
VATHHLPSIVTKNNRISVACDNMYTMESKDEFVFVNFFVHPIPLSFVINVICNLFKANKGILVTNVICDKNLTIKTNRECVFLLMLNFR